MRHACYAACAGAPCWFSFLINHRFAKTYRMREREMVPTPYLLILGGMSSGSRRYGLHAWRVLFQFGRALLRINREHSPGSRFWRALLRINREHSPGSRCTTPGCWPRGTAGVMDLFSARWDDLRSTADLAVILYAHFPPHWPVTAVCLGSMWLCLLSIAYLPAATHAQPHMRKPPVRRRG